MKKIPDIDIDFYDRDSAAAIIDHIPASMIVQGNLTRHNVGIYLQDIPVDPYTNCSSIPYKQAEERKYFKFDFLNVSIYKDVESNDHLELLVKTEPNWDMLNHEEIVKELFQISSHFEIVNKMKPTSVEELAMVIAMIRPAKRHLIGKSWPEVKAEIWTKPEDGYYFKKSHSMSYALAIVVQMNCLAGVKLA